VPEAQATGGSTIQRIGAARRMEIGERRIGLGVRRAANLSQTARRWPSASWGAAAGTWAAVIAAAVPGWPTGAAAQAVSVETAQARAVAIGSVDVEPIASAAGISHAPAVEAGTRSAAAPGDTIDPSTARAAAVAPQVLGRPASPVVAAAAAVAAAGVVVVAEAGGAANAAWQRFVEGPQT